ncbi:hypothetical protein M2T78_07410 [Elizabethkingia ursingii]|uniref:hypothetical protein n=1 Tax=Elizabethkingia ursingii TaxID=1756150 RepID=UPI002012F7BF|nr:hypothetical protein [Elizabethkingia ursingii]MCL1664075.1 hypothetical protein [Elizabethkingia ursingii]
MELKPKAKQLTLINISQLNIKYIRIFLVFISSTIMVLSGVLPFMDNILVKFYPEQMKEPLGGFPSKEIALFYFTLFVLPTMILIASKLKPYKYTYIFPIFSYSILIFGYTAKGFDYDFDFNVVAYISFFIVAIFIFKIFDRTLKYIRLIFELDDYKTTVINRTTQYFDAQSINKTE